MFTGLIEEMGKILTVAKSAQGAKITIAAKKVLEDVLLGDSICTNGICLTVTSFDKDRFSVDVMAETMRRSNFQHIAPGDAVNLERALRVGDRLGGHMVSGHIDGVGVIKSYEKEDNAIWITIEAREDLLKYIIMKGSITIDGVSLTVAYVDQEKFKVSVIPHTKDMTTLLLKGTGSEVNLECDMVGKYIEKFMSYEEKRPKKQKLNEDFLKEHGYL